MEEVVDVQRERIEIAHKHFTTEQKSGKAEKLESAKKRRAI